MPDCCECGRPYPLHANRAPHFSEAERQALTQALCAAFEMSAPVLSEALSAAIQAQIERAVGHGVVAWVKRLLIAAAIALAGYALKGSTHP